MGLLYVNGIDIDGLLYSITYAVSVYSIALTLSVSMYLMKGHNEGNFVKFLKVIQLLRLNFLCSKISKQFRIETISFNFFEY